MPRTVAHKVRMVVMILAMGLAVWRCYANLTFWATAMGSIVVFIFVIFVFVLVL